jgi:hypothetical protein
VVERCPDKTEVDGPIPSTLTEDVILIFKQTHCRLYYNIATSLGCHESKLSSHSSFVAIRQRSMVRFVLANRKSQARRCRDGVAEILSRELSVTESVLAFPSTLTDLHHWHFCLILYKSLTRLCFCDRTTRQCA